MISYDILIQKILYSVPDPIVLVLGYDPTIIIKMLPDPDTMVCDTACSRNFKTYQTVLTKTTRKR